MAVNIHNWTIPTSNDGMTLIKTVYVILPEYSPDEGDNLTDQEDSYERLAV